MRKQEINRIRDQFDGGQWPQFLEFIEIDGLRGWKGQSVHFRFPIAAVVGENGTGKSTVLKVAASAYIPKKGKGYYPSEFFQSTHWDNIQGVSLSYRIKNGNETEIFTVKKPTKRWSFPEKRFSRDVFWFDISRTLPLDATAGYARVAKLASEEISSEFIQDDFKDKLSYILGREYRSARFAAPDINEQRIVGLLGRDYGEISQFHQGAGEDTTLDLIRSLQTVPSNALVLIDEIEASLHPKAQRRLMECLVELCRHKRIQIIVTTHSPFVLEELPPEARIMLIPTSEGPNVIYRISPEFSLSKLDDVIHPELYAYVEDRVAEIWLREIIAQDPEGADLLQRIKITSVGPSNAVVMMGKLADEGRLSHKAIGVIDGDVDESPGCIRLPGNNAPEQVVFEGLRAKNWPNLPQRFGIGAGTLLGYFEDAMLNGDHHRWTTLIGDKIIKSSHSVWETLATEWCRSCLEDDERRFIIAEFEKRLNP